MLSQVYPLVDAKVPSRSGSRGVRSPTKAQKENSRVRIVHSSFFQVCHNLNLGDATGEDQRFNLAREFVPADSRHISTSIRYFYFCILHDINTPSLFGKDNAFNYSSSQALYLAFVRIVMIKNLQHPEGKKYSDTGNRTPSYRELISLKR